MTIGFQEWENSELAGGRYRVIAKLGEGGMGFVYRALDQNIDSEVVIKVPRQTMMDDPEFAGRFTREIRSLVKLSHPHIVKVTDVGTLEGMPFAVMQFLSGGSLEDQRATGPEGQVLPADPKKVGRWLLAVAEALDYIHTQGYVHRDVKPGNILFDSLGHAFLSDFGVAKVLASSTSAAPSQTAMTGAGMVLGTPEYMAPELIMGEPFDGRADQYALAITVYEMLCGRRPFEDETKTKVLVLHTSKLPPALTTWCQTLPDRLSQAVLKGLAKDPAQRYATCVDFAKAIAVAAEGAAARDDRVRLKCSACGKTGSMTAADFAKLKAGGGRASCPACKAPIDIPSPDVAAPGAGPGGTMKVSFTGNAGEYSVASPPLAARGGTMVLGSLGGSTGSEHPSPAVPPPIRAATVAMSASAGLAQNPAAAQGKPPPRRGSGTVIERALPPPGEAAAAAIFNNLAASGTEHSGSITGKKPAENRPATADKTWLWAAGGAAAATLLVAMAGFAFFLSGSKKVPDTSPRTTTNQALAPGIPASKPQTAPISSTPPPTVGPLTKQPALADLSKQSTSPTTPQKAERPKRDIPAPTTGTDELASEAQPATAKNEQPKPSKTAANSTAAPPSQPAAAGSIFATSDFDAARLPKKSRPLPYNVETVIKKARSYSGQVVVPAGMYSLSRSSANQRSGPRKYVVTECSLKEQGPNRELQMTALGSSELEVDPRLASRFDGMDSKILSASVAVLTLWIGDSGVCGVVRADVLEKCEPRLKKGFGIGQADVDYYTLSMSADESKSGKVPDELWQRPGRMMLFYTHWKRHVDGMRKRQQTADMAGLTNLMGDMYKGAMRSTAADAAAQAARQHAISGR